MIWPARAANDAAVGGEPSLPGGGARATGFRQSGLEWPGHTGTERPRRRRRRQARCRPAAMGTSDASTAALCGRAAGGRGRVVGSAAHPVWTASTQQWAGTASRRSASPGAPRARRAAARRAAGATGCLPRDHCACGWAGRGGAAAARSRSAGEGGAALCFRQTAQAIYHHHRLGDATQGEAARHPSFVVSHNLIHTHAEHKLSYGRYSTLGRHKA